MIVLEIDPLLNPFIVGDFTFDNPLKETLDAILMLRSEKLELLIEILDLKNGIAKVENCPELLKLAKIIFDCRKIVSTQ